jgi:ABC-type cobalt transport system substrate-binding protein
MVAITDPTFKNLYIGMQKNARFYKLTFWVTIIMIIVATTLFAFSIVYYNNDSKYRNNTEKANDFLTLLFPEYKDFKSS